MQNKNIPLKRKVDGLKKKDRETKDEMKQLSLTVRQLVKKLEKLTES